MKTTHEVYFKDARTMDEVASDTVDMLLTSPPYPMIEMWDSVFSSLNGEIAARRFEPKAKQRYQSAYF